MVAKEKTNYTMQMFSQKAKQLAINKYMDDSKKAMRADKRIFSDLATIKAQQDSGITIPNKNWHIVLDHDTE